ncbi:unnamed protein product [Durusdinium trenchii]|uniref:Uncharacterized protein n=1 Tax=Durusdinium trenchii TaxID=1381693 RepID=A0ABP0KQU9_9DINO
MMAFDWKCSLDPVRCPSWLPWEDEPCEAFMLPSTLRTLLGPKAEVPECETLASTASSDNERGPATPQREDEPCEAFMLPLSTLRTLVPVEEECQFLLPSALRPRPDPKLFQEEDDLCVFQ